jgi:3'5'-cyclic nucleotide phosphodiesterase
MSRRIEVNTNIPMTKIDPYTSDNSSNPIDEVKEVISMGDYHSMFTSNVTNETGREAILDTATVRELHCYVSIIATMYRDENPFHNFQHACHVTMSVSKLLKRIATPQFDVQENEENRIDEAIQCDTGAYLHSYTYGISSDPLAIFAIVFSALIHDVDHRGCSNAQLIREESYLGSRYKNKSVAEQNSLDLSWNLLMSDQFRHLRQCIFPCKEDMLRFRQIVINVVLATDIFDKELNDLRKIRWTKAFSETAESDVEHSNRKATIVIEHVIQASDVAHTMQHWHVYVKWNSKLFRELYIAYQNGRMAVDPSTFWYEGELQFFDNYVIPLAKKLKECQVFGVSSDEYLTYASKLVFRCVA